MKLYDLFISLPTIESDELASRCRPVKCKRCAECPPHGFQFYGINGIFNVSNVCLDCLEELGFYDPNRIFYR